MIVETAVGHITVQVILRHVRPIRRPKTTSHRRINVTERGVPSADGSREGVPAAASAVGAAYVCTRGRSPHESGADGVPNRRLCGDWGAPIRGGGRRFVAGGAKVQRSRKGVPDRPLCGDWGRRSSHLGGRSPGGSQLRDSREGVPDRGFARAGATGSTRDNLGPAPSRPSKAREVPGCHAQRDPPSSSFPDEARMRAASGHTVVEHCSTTVCD